MIVFHRVFPRRFPTGDFSISISRHNLVTVLRYRPWESVAVQVPVCGVSIFDLAGRSGFRVGWAQFPDEAEVIYLYDRDDEGFGYAINLDAPDCSEWGYSPFGETAA